MRWHELDREPCSIARTVAVIGDRWTLLVLRECFLGVRRFEEFQQHLGIARHRLSDRLNRLVEHEVLKKVPYQDKPPRLEYRLTDKGLDLYPVLVALMEWGDRHAVGPAGPQVLLRHRDCGEPVRLEMSCAAGHVVESPREVTPMPGPGARKIA